MRVYNEQSVFVVELVERMLQLLFLFGINRFDFRTDLSDFMKIYIKQYKRAFGEYEVNLKESWTKAIHNCNDYGGFISAMTKDLNEPYVVITYVFCYHL